MSLYFQKHRRVAQPPHAPPFLVNALEDSDKQGHSSLCHEGLSQLFIGGFLS